VLPRRLSLKLCPFWLSQEAVPHSELKERLWALGYCRHLYVCFNQEIKQEITTSPNICH
jgi:hypothetical protein